MAYTTTAAVYAEGVVEANFPAPLVQGRIDEVTELFDNITGTWFEPRTFDVASVYGIMLRNGSGRRILRMPAPIISIAEIRYVDHTVDPATTEVVPSTEYFAHDRLSGPDDRWAPKVSLIGIGGRFGSSVGVNRRRENRGWTRGFRNIEVDGTFGFMEIDPAGPAGTLRTPLEIQRSAIAMVIHLLPDMADPAAAEERRLGDLRAFEVADRKETYGPMLRNTSSTGLPDVDRVLLRYSHRFRARGLHGEQG